MCHCRRFERPNYSSSSSFFPFCRDGLFRTGALSLSPSAQLAPSSTGRQSLSWGVRRTLGSSTKGWSHFYFVARSTTFMGNQGTTVQEILVCVCILVSRMWMAPPHILWKPFQPYFFRQCSACRCSVTRWIPHTLSMVYKGQSISDSYGGA